MKYLTKVIEGVLVHWGGRKDRVGKRVPNNETIQAGVTEPCSSRPERER